MSSPQTYIPELQSSQSAIALSIDLNAYSSLKSTPLSGLDDLGTADGSTIAESSPSTPKTPKENNFLPDLPSLAYLNGYVTENITRRQISAFQGPSGAETPGSVNNTTKVSLADGKNNTYSMVSGQNERLKMRLFSAFFAYFLCGWGDGITGTVLPYFEADFHISYMVSSLLFVGGAVGFGIGTIILERVMSFIGCFHPASTNTSYLPAVSILSRLHRFSVPAELSSHPLATGHSPSQARYLAIVLASVLHSCHFVVMGLKRGFPSMIFAYALAGFSRAFLTASLNSYVASTPKRPLGHLMGFWTVGAFVSPLVCQTIIAKGVPWPHFYFGSLVVSAINLCLLLHTFRPTLNELSSDRKAALESRSTPFRGEKEICAVEFAQEIQIPSLPNEAKTPLSIPLSGAPPHVSTLRRSLRMPYQWALSAFSWIYCGSETITSGFITIYLLAVRHSNSKTVGYVSSGFWAGESIGRFLWGHFSSSMNFTQKKHAIHICLVLALIMHLLLWLVPSNIENAVSVGIIGVAYGPIFPATLDMACSILSPDVHMVSMALISAFGSLGNALFPFVVGIISNNQGPHILPCVTVAMGSCMVCMWFFFPSRWPRSTGLSVA